MVGYYPFGILMAAGFNYAGVASVVAAMTAVVALFLSNKSNKRQQQNTESVSYVDNNLKTMQGAMDWVKADNVSLREDNDYLRKVDETRRQENIALKIELERVKEELASCRDACTILLAEQRAMKQIGESDDSRG